MGAVKAQILGHGLKYDPATRLSIPVSQLIKEYKETPATSYSLAEKYGICQRHISRMLHDNLSEFTRKQLEGEKKSAAAKRKWAERKSACQD